MYPRLLQPPPKQSFFLFGPRGVGKTAWAHDQFPAALFFDLLDHQTYTQLLAAPQRLGDQIPHGHKGWVVVDEIQRVPELLNEVHRLIESRRLRFVLTFTRRHAGRFSWMANRVLAMQPVDDGQPLDTRKLPRIAGGERYAKAQRMCADQHVQ